MGGGSGGGGGALGGAHKGEVSADPMLNANAVAPSLLLAGVAAAAGSVPPEPVGGSRLGGATELSAEEESRLFAEVDQLDPEERAFAAGASATELEVVVPLEISMNGITFTGAPAQATSHTTAHSSSTLCWRPPWRQGAGCSLPTTTSARCR